jgi:hypothetical protein
MIPRKSIHLVAIAMMGYPDSPHPARAHVPSPRARGEGAMLEIFHHLVVPAELARAWIPTGVYSVLDTGGGMTMQAKHEGHGFPKKES